MAYGAPFSKLRTDHRLPSPETISIMPDRNSQSSHSNTPTDSPPPATCEPVLFEIRFQAPHKSIVLSLTCISAANARNMHDMSTQEQYYQPLQVVLHRLVTYRTLSFRFRAFFINTQKIEYEKRHIPVKRNPLPCPFCNLPVKSAQSPAKIVPQPSNKEICKWKSCKILINASFSPGISNPFLILRRSRIGDISTPTFSKSPLIKVGRVSEYLSRSSQRSSSACSLANSIA